MAQQQPISQKPLDYWISAGSIVELEIEAQKIVKSLLKDYEIYWRKGIVQDSFRSYVDAMSAIERRLIPEYISALAKYCKAAHCHYEEELLTGLARCLEAEFGVIKYKSFDTS